MNIIQSTAVAATGLLSLPKWNGPFTKRSAYTSLNAIGMPYDVYNPIVAILVAALKATEEPRDGRDRRKERLQASHTVRTGDFRRESTLWKNRAPGRAPSREKANIMRELEVIENVLWRQDQC